VHCETVGRCARLEESKPANPITGSEAVAVAGEWVQNRPNPIAGTASAAAAHQAFIEAAREKGLSAQRIWQDLVELHGYSHGF
jgi:hypothetical protein